MKKIINGRKLAEKINDEVVKEIIRLDQRSSLNKGKSGLIKTRPNLAIILIGDRKDSEMYVNMKEREAKKVGIDTHLYKCPKNIDEREVFEMINVLNKDDSIDAILVQLPLPKGFDTDGIMMAIDPEKDVDRFHPDNLEVLLKTCNHAHVMPPVFGVVLEILKSINYNLARKRACVISNSDIFGLSLAKVLECQKMNVIRTRIKDPELNAACSQADILITAVGKPHFIKKDMVKKDAVVIDIGITLEKGKVKGDVDFKDVEDKVGFITPVPGGVGPMTIAMLFKNTLELFKKRNGLD